METAATSRLAARATQDAWREHLLAVEAQGLEDLSRSGASEVIFLRQPKATGQWELLDPLEERARARGFLTARVSVLADQAFDSLDGLVRAVARNLQCHEAPKARGVVALLDRFIARHAGSQEALAAFDRGVLAWHAGGDLVALARAYVDARRKPSHEARRIDAWLAGTELARAESDDTAFAALSPRTAKRGLGEITRLARVLGWKGTVAVFAGAEALTRLPPGRREDAYTVLRELIDNADGGRGLVSMQAVVSGSATLFDGARGLRTLAPLAMRAMPLGDAPDELPPPHRPVVDATPPEGWRAPLDPPEPQGTSNAALPALRAVIRAAQGLPPAEPVPSMSVGHEKIDRTITALFEHAAMQSSVFALLTGAYGTGKSHLLMHLTGRALADRRPVFRLSLERLDMDLGSPQRHLRRMLEHATLPLPGQPTALDRLAAWTRSSQQCRRLLDALEALAAEGGDVAGPAKKALAFAARAPNAGAALESWLGAAELATRPSNANYRQDAYQRLLLWIALLERVEKCAGPVLLVDEAENLYRNGTSRADRRTALRTLSFYCGGTLPGACVVMAITPDALASLRAEASELLDDVAEQRTVLAWEDAAMFRRRLTATVPVEVPALTSESRVVLAFRAQATHAKVRGPVFDPHWARWVSEVVKEDVPPRLLVRRVIDRLERCWWAERTQRAQPSASTPA
ncbi:MAG: BREX system ATP-binding domain-containing protein [Polyangiales bacterium]